MDNRLFLVYLHRLCDVFFVDGLLRRPRHHLLVDVGGLILRRHPEKKQFTSLELFGLWVLVLVLDPQYGVEGIQIIAYVSDLLIYVLKY